MEIFHFLLAILLAACSVFLGGVTCGVIGVLILTNLRQWNYEVAFRICFKYGAIAVALATAVAVVMVASASATFTPAFLAVCLASAGYSLSVTLFFVVIWAFLIWGWPRKGA